MSPDRKVAKRPFESRYFLTTKRLGFRRWRESDVSLALGLWGDPAVTRHIEARTLAPDQIRARLVEEIASQRRFGVQYWPIFLLTTGDHVGCCGLRPREPEAAVYELGVHIRSRCWRRGYAYEAASRVVEHAFRDLVVRSLFAGHHPANTASRSLLTKLGFRHTHDEYYAPTGLRHPSYRLDAPSP